MKLRILAAAVLTLLAAGAPAGARVAHGGAGLIEVEAAHPTATGTHYIVRLTYQNDGDPVADAAVTATPVGPDGRELAAVELAPYDDDGRYEGAIEMPDPGSWTVRFASAEPEASAETTTEISATASTEATTTSEGAGFAAADDGTGDSADAADETSDDSDGFPVLIVIAAAVVAVGGLFAALRVIRRNRPGPGSPAAGAEPADSATGTPPPGADGES